MKIGEAMYKAQGAQGGSDGGAPGGGGHEGGSAGGPGGHDEKVVDAEFEEVDPNKKKSA
jgi:molecular chaperone DnaK